jgi:hypothetical protein
VVDLNSGFVLIGMALRHDQEPLPVWEWVPIKLNNRNPNQTSTTLSP